MREARLTVTQTPSDRASAWARRLDTDWSSRRKARRHGPMPIHPTYAVGLGAATKRRRIRDGEIGLHARHRALDAFLGERVLQRAQCRCRVTLAAMLRRGERLEQVRVTGRERQCHLQVLDPRRAEGDPDAMCDPAVGQHQHEAALPPGQPPPDFHLWNGPGEIARTRPLPQAAATGIAGRAHRTSSSGRSRRRGAVDRRSRRGRGSTARPVLRVAGFRALDESSTWSGPAGSATRAYAASLRSLHDSLGPRMPSRSG